MLQINQLEKIMKHLHMLMAVLTIACFCYSSFCILKGKQVGKAYMAVTHSLYAILVGSGLYLLWVISQVAGVQHWAYAKLILLVVAVSSMIKARKSKTPSQAKAGILVTFVALAGILYLAIAKPILG